MKQEEMLIVPTQEIAFGLKKDGTFIYSKVSGPIIKDLFSNGIDGLLKVFESLERQDFIAASLFWSFSQKRLANSLAEIAKKKFNVDD